MHHTIINQTNFVCQSAHSFTSSRGLSCDNYTKEFIKWRWLKNSSKCETSIAITTPVCRRRCIIMVVMMMMIIVAMTVVRILVRITGVIDFSLARYIGNRLHFFFFQFGKTKEKVEKSLKTCRIITKCDKRHSIYVDLKNFNLELDLIRKTLHLKIFIVSLL